jgi:hypothetical protein
LESEKRKDESNLNPLPKGDLISLLQMAPVRRCSRKHPSKEDGDEPRSRCPKGVTFLFLIVIEPQLDGEIKTFRRHMDSNQMLSAPSKLNRFGQNPLSPSGYSQN